MRQIALIAVFFLSIQFVTGQKVSHDSVAIFFDEIRTASKKNTELWDRDLYGPTILIDPKTREILANESDTGGLLKADGSLYSGILPAQINIANTAFSWNGKRWTMVMLPLPQNKQNRIHLLAHESFHNIQPGLGFKLNNTENNHLDQKEGRIYLRLELEALKKALQSSSEKEMKEHLTHALIFRKYRHLLYNGAAAAENSLELNEGIAEFTGAVVSGRNILQSKTFFINGIDEFFGNPTFVRSFAYYTAPVYLYLSYHKERNGHKKIKSDTDLTDYFIQAFKIYIPADLKTTAGKISGYYNGNVIIKEEKEREEKTKKLIAAYQLKFIDRPHFEIQFEKMNVSFDPRNIIPLGDQGTVYPNIRVTDLWGILTVENGALMSPKWDKISITNPTGTEGEKIAGDGWTLELKDGYSLEKDQTNGNYKLKKNKN
ncbi:hypothetical protein [Chryseobacterium sp.]|uniref:hypothetical protein n=1 Tax=Chryseobacterium sp. TaxID=1871047 RepID=UPI0025C2B7BA|nr:hypothetical protein [Chryseobacterium sp.]MBV8327450.1 hypothetical protein [Chryseobacterium sp.]